MTAINFTNSTYGYPSSPQEHMPLPQSRPPVDLEAIHLEVPENFKNTELERELKEHRDTSWDREGVQKAVEEMNAIIDGMVNQQLRFDVYDGTDQLYVQVVDRRSNEILRVMPPEELLSLRSRIRNAIGVILDTEF